MKKNADRDSKEQKSKSVAVKAPTAIAVKAPPASKAAKKPAGPPSDDAAEVPAGPSIVGVGASAGGLEAFTQLLGALPRDTGLAFVLVQHLEPKHESVLTRLLARTTKMPVQEVREGMHVEPNHVYVIPANADLSLLDGLLHVVGRQAAAGRHLPIDYFFQSLAESRGPQAIGVILSGTASDGTAGIKAIKEAGGITFAQDPQSAKFDGMPRNAIASGYVDLVLPPERIAKELTRIMSHPFLGPLQLGEVPPLPALEEEWVRLFRLLRSATGVDFRLYKQATVKRRLARRMAVCKAQNLGAYLKILEHSPREIDALFGELLILVTEFFRDPDVFLALRSKICPRILAEKPVGEPIRIWVVGCSTGEEAYSIAISFLDCLGEKAAGTQIQIFATDVSESAIEKARLGIYSATGVKGVSKEQLRRYFTPVNGTFQINQPIREMCVFARHDLTRDPPFSKLDLISCRNVLIYLETPLQKRILAAFHWGLKSSGVLLLGKSESLGAYADLFTAMDRKTKFFKKSIGAHAPLVMAQPVYEQVFAGKPPFKEAPAGIDLEKEADQALWERSGYAGLVVNSDLQILHFRGDTSPYLRPVPGKASLQLMRILREEIVLEARTALQKARRSERAVRSEGIELHHNGRASKVNIEVRPLILGGPEKSFLILFEPGAAPAAAPSKAPQGRAQKEGPKGRSQEMRSLRDELARTRQYVQTIIRDQEVSNEELKTANEEALSSMEELQSTNEELETAKEELQSSNEELVTLNEQLQNRNSELGQLSNDLGNILSGIDIPVVILDSESHIRRFTPPAEKLLGLITGDIGRPIGKLRIGIHLPDLDDLISAAIEKGKVSVREVQSESGQWYLVRINPFVAGEDKVQGVLMAFVDVHEMKQLQEKTTQSESTIRALLETAAQGILAVDSDGQIRLANASAETMFGYSRDLLLGQGVESLIPERFRADHVRYRKGWFAEPHNRAAMELTGLRKDASEFPIEVSLGSIRADGETLSVAFISDITERKKNEQALVDQLASEVVALRGLREMEDFLWRAHDMRDGLEAIIDMGMAVLKADFGNIQLWKPEKQVLEIAAQRGFGPNFLQHFREVSPADTSACGRGLRTGKRVVIEDVKADAEYAPHRAAAGSAGYRAVQSTPLLGVDGRPLGMFSTHFSQPHRPSEQELGWFDLYAVRAAQFIERIGAEQELQRLTGALLSLQEEGNREVARELHDVYSQELVVLGMGIASLKENAKSDPDLAKHLSELSDRIGDVAESLHTASRKLHPAMVEELGLEPVLRQECEAFQQATGISTDFTAKELPAKLPRALALCLYRIAQETMRNIRKHAANASKVRVSLTGSADGITLVVQDNGGGFDPDIGRSKGGLGLISMEERLRLINGKLTIQSQRGEGTLVSAFAPLLEVRDET